MSGKILVIDDELLILDTVEKALTRIGYSVAKAQNMEELAAALRNAPFDLMITDLHMDEDTVENIIARVKESSPEIKVLLMSGGSNRTAAENFIEKPFKLEELRGKVRAYLNEPS
ncbi:MAG: response regulator [Nitrospirota bacterium]|nr:response regulator [Nitrospirota bacterium]